MSLKKSYVWNYFQKSSLTDIATCLICKKEYRTCGNTSNIIAHLKRTHKNVMETEAENDTNELTLSDSTDTSESSFSLIKRRKQERLDHFVSKDQHYKNKNTRKIEIDEKVAMMVATDLQPYSFVEDKGFRSLMHIMDPKYVVPSRESIKSKLNGDIFNKVYTKIIEILSEVKYVSLTTDLWTSSNNTESYCTITCHFIYKHKMEAAVLDTSELPGSHTAQHLKEHILAVATKFKVLKKIVCIVTDNAASEKLACSLLQVPHLPCFAHTLNLVVVDGINGVPEFKNILEKVRNIVTHFKRSNVAMDILREQQRKSDVKELKLLKDVATRWNSILTMIRRVLEIGDCLILSLAKCPNAPLPLEANDINILSEAVMILTIFEKATEQMSGDKYITASLIIPITLGIYTQLSHAEPSIENPEIKNLLNILKQCVVKRLFPYEMRSTVQLASILDPRIKKLGFRIAENASQGQVSLQQEVVRIINSQSDSLEPSIQASSSTEKSSDANNDGHNKISFPLTLNKSGRDLSLFQFLKERTEKASDLNPTSESIILIRQYLEVPLREMDTDALQYWKNAPYKYLDTLACKYLCVPATSVPSERVFSQAGIIISTKRSRLKSKNVNKMIFVGKNERFLNM